MNALPENIAALAAMQAAERSERSDPWAAPPLPLYRELPAPAAFPVEALGPVLLPAVQAVARIVQPPLALAANSALGAAALAVQAHADVVVDGRSAATSLYLVTVAESGARKSATDTVMLSPHYATERALADIYKLLFAKYETAKLAWEKARDDALRQADGVEAKKAAVAAIGPRPTEPMAPWLTCEEPTYEGLVKLLMIGRPALGLFSDEGGRFLGGNALSAENRMKTLSGLSNLWDGRRVTRTRSGDGASTLYGRRLSLHLMVQPVVAPSLLGDRLAVEQGVLARCLVTWPESTIGAQRYVAEDVHDDPGFRTYCDRVGALLTRPLPTGDDPRELQPRALVLAEDAKGRWVAFHDWVQKHLHRDGALRPVVALAAKAGEHALRLAGVLAVVDDPEVRVVDLRHVEAGIMLARFYLDEALRIHGVTATADDLFIAARLLGWMQSRGRLVSLVDVYQYGPAAVRDKATAVRLLDLLESHGWARKVAGGAEIEGQRRRDVWEVRS